MNFMEFMLSSTKKNLIEIMTSVHSRNEQAVKELQGWGLKFSPSVVGVDGRVLPPETIRQNQKSFSYKPADADWSREMRGLPLISCVPLQNWIMVYTGRNEQVAMEFLSNLKRVGPPMGIRVADPVRYVELNG